MTRPTQDVPKCQCTCGNRGCVTRQRALQTPEQVAAKLKANDARATKRKAALQAKTLAEAKNWGKIWTGPEMELIVNRPDLTAVQLALMLGRSANGVKVMRHKINQNPQLAQIASLPSVGLDASHEH